MGKVNIIQIKYSIKKIYMSLSILKYTILIYFKTLGNFEAEVFNKNETFEIFPGGQTRFADFFDSIAVDLKSAKNIVKL